MEVCVFKEQKYARIQDFLFIYDETWGSLRPIEKVGWNGKQFVVDDSEFKKDLFNPFYGYGSNEMKLLSKCLTDEFDSHSVETIVDPVVFWKWCGTPTTWFKDRPVVFVNTCNTLDWRAYISYLSSKHRTIRRPAKGRLTRRLVRK